MDLTFRVVRDLFSPDIEEFVVDTEAAYEKVPPVRETLVPQLASRVKLYEGPQPIFEVDRHREGDRQGAPPAGVAQVRRVHRHRPHRGAGRHRRQHRASTSASATSRRRCSRSTSRRRPRWSARSACATWAASSSSTSSTWSAPSTATRCSRALAEGARRRQGAHQRARDLRARHRRDDAQARAPGAPLVFYVCCPTCKGTGTSSPTRRSPPRSSGRSRRAPEAAGAGGGTARTRRWPTTRGGGARGARAAPGAHRTEDLRAGMPSYHREAV